jgi:murein DD-endopeptidase MepM/ murein hydrolase activator NlpD
MIRIPAICTLALIVTAGGIGGTTRSEVAPQAAPIELSVPAAPVPVTAAGRISLVYELHIVNGGKVPLSIERVEVRDVDHRDAAPVATYDRSALKHDIKLIGPRGAPSPSSLMPGVRAVVFFWLAFDPSAVVPKTLAHHVVFADKTAADAPPLTVRPPANLTFTAPVGAGDWWMGLGPSSTADHRRAVIRVGEDPVPHLAQRFGIDWVQMDARGEYARDRRGRRNEDWYGYGAPVLSVADAHVAAVVDGIPDNTPGESSRAVEMKVATVTGNYVLLELAPGPGGERRFALYGHLKPGSLLVREGDVVRRGQPLGAIGNSGNSDGPHLHLHVTEAADAATAPLRGEGVPFLLESFTVVAHDPERVKQKALLSAMGLHHMELPVEGDVLRIARQTDVAGARHR